MHTHDSTFEQLVSDVKKTGVAIKTEAAINRDKKMAWKCILPTLNAILDADGLDTDPEVRKAYLGFLKPLWEVGYIAGMLDANKFDAKQSGAGSPADIIALFEKQLNPKPENN